MTKPLAIIRFVHDLEDGWFTLREPGGSTSDWNWSESARLHCAKNGWDLVYVGAAMYRPEKIPMAKGRKYTLL